MKRSPHTPGALHTLLLSGGMDSTAILVEHPIDLCVFVAYGQPAQEQEREAATRISDLYGAPLKIVSVSPLALRTMEDETGKPGPRVVPGRNAILLSIAANLTKPVGAVYIGCCLDDLQAYPDCGEPFIQAVSHALSVGYGVRVEAPLLYKTKQQIRQILAKNHRAYLLCWSCYTPVDGEPCETCNSCLARESADA